MYDSRSLLVVDVAAAKIFVKKSGIQHEYAEKDVLSGFQWELKAVYGTTTS